MTTAMATTNGSGHDAIEAVIAKGDLAKLTPAERVNYYVRLCESMGLNPLTRPFEYLVLSGKTVLYATKGCTDQLREIHGVSVTGLDAEHLGDGLYRVIAKVVNAKGRIDQASGVVVLAGLRGENLANALMKAETKAKRRATLSLCGLGFLDESDVDSIGGATRVHVDHSSGQIDRPALSASGKPRTLDDVAAMPAEAARHAEIVGRASTDMPAGTAVYIDPATGEVTPITGDVTPRPTMADLEAAVESAAKRLRLARTVETLAEEWTSQTATRHQLHKTKRKDLLDYLAALKDETKAAIVKRLESEQQPQEGHWIDDPTTGDPEPMDMP